MEEKYDFTKFSEEDRREYEELLGNMPYSRELAEFFHDEKKRYERDEKRRKRYMTGLELDSVLATAYLPAGNNERISFTHNFSAALKSIRACDRNRVSGYYLEEKSVRCIADEEGCSPASVYRTLRLFREAARKEYYGGAVTENK